MNIPEERAKVEKLVRKEYGPRLSRYVIHPQTGAPVYVEVWLTDKSHRVLSIKRK